MMKVFKQQIRILMMIGIAKKYKKIVFMGKMSQMLALKLQKLFNLTSLLHSFIKLTSRLYHKS